MSYVLALPCMVVSAVAQDTGGTVLINQTVITAAGGFPYHITQPGSYRLSSNLSVNTPSIGLSIDSEGVTLDLGGFSITGPGAQAGVSIGIYSSGYRDITVKNGSVRSFAYGINLNDSGGGSIVDVQATYNQYGLRLGGFSVSRCAATYNSVIGMLLTDSVVQQSTVIGNGTGIVLGDSIALGNIVNRNQYGISEFRTTRNMTAFAGSNTLIGNTYNFSGFTSTGQALPYGGTVISQGNNVCATLGPANNNAAPC
jgi:hypothetical protein